MFWPDSKCYYYQNAFITQESFFYFFIFLLILNPHDCPVFPQECGLHCGGNADPEASVGRVRSHGGHFQDRHAAHEAHAARGCVRLLQGLPAAGVCGGEVAADGGRPAEPPLCAGQLLKSWKSPSPSPPHPPAPPLGSPAFTTSTAATVIAQDSASLQLPAMLSITSVCLAMRDARLLVFDLPEE